MLCYVTSGPHCVIELYSHEYLSLEYQVSIHRKDDGLQVASYSGPHTERGRGPGDTWQNVASHC